MDKKTIVINLMILIFTISLVSCSSETTAISAKNAIESYASTYVKNMPNEDMRNMLLTKENELVNKALNYFLNEPDLKDLDSKDKVKVSVLMAIMEFTKPPT